MKSQKKKAPAQDRHHTHTYLNTVSNLSLLLFVVFIVLFIAGSYQKNDYLTFLGLGIGISVSIYTLFNNMEDDDDYQERM